MYIGIDIGGTNVRVACTSDLKKPIFSKRKSFDNKHDFNDYFRKVISFIKEQGTVDGIGVSIAGDLNPERTMVVDSATNAPEIINQPIVVTLREEFKCPVVMDNDGTAMALGEAVYGGLIVDKFIYLIWGTGIGGAVVKRTSQKFVVDQIDWFKHFEEWEYKCGGRAIGDLYGKPAKDISEEEWSEVIKHFDHYLNKLLKNFPVEVVVIGGGVGLNQFARLADITCPAKLSLTTLGADAGLLGGIALVKNNIK